MKVVSEHFLVDDNGFRFSSPKDAAVEEAVNRHYLSLRDKVPQGVNDRALRIILTALVTNPFLAMEIGAMIDDCNKLQSQFSCMLKAASEMAPIAVEIPRASN